MKRIIPLTPRRWLALEIFRRMKHERVEEHPLRQLFWECTLRCNVRCRHCGSDCKSSPATPDMPLQDFLKVLDSIATHTNPHDVFVIISGGEPTVREDLETCGKEISRRGYPWGMVCNGLCLTRERLHNLIRSGMRSISISLDGLKDVHNWMRRHPESFDCAVNAIREITAIPELTFDVITCVTRRSLPQLPAMKELLISLGVKRWRESTIFPVGRAAEEPEFRMNGEELKQYIKRSGMSVAAVAEELGTSPQNLNAKFNRKSIKIDFFQKIKEIIENTKFRGDFFSLKPRIKLKKVAQ